MKKILTGALAALSLGGAALSGATPAAAQHWGGYGEHHEGWGGYRGYYHHDHDRDGAGIALGVLGGLAVGAAIASSSHPHYYAPAPRYYAAPPPAYYVGPTYYYAGPVCRTHYRWDPYWGRYVTVERCY